MKLRKTDTSDHYTSPPQQQTPPRLANIKEAWTKNEDTDSEYLKRYKRIQARVWQSHFDKACGVLMRADKGMQKSSSTEDKEKKTPLQSESDMFGENSLCSGYLKLREMTESQHRPKDVFCSTASRRYFLPKEDAFTGSEAVALRKLLKTLRIKKWGPQVYFHIRFFSVRHKLLAMTAEKKVLVGILCVFVYMCLCVESECGVGVGVYICMCTCACVCVCVCVCMCVCVCVCLVRGVCVGVCVCVCV